jgi:porin
MTTTKFIRYSTVLLFFITSGSYSRIAAQTESSLSFNASYIGDWVTNLHGGIKTGSTYLGLANLKLGFDTEKARWWKGGSFFINAGNTHGGEPSTRLVGDFQGVSNIEAGNLTFMYELWYKQQIGRVELTAGLQDLNVNFAATSYGSVFNNSSFGIQSSIADNIPSPIFPLTALGVSLQWNISSSISWKMALFDGTPDDYQSNPNNIHWKLSKNDGYLAISEWQLATSLIRGLEGEYKLGIYAHRHNDSTQVALHNHGIYLIADQQIIKTHNGGVGLFSQLGLTPRKNSNNYYCSLGVNWQAPFSSRPDDECGIAFAYAGMHDNNGIGGELSIEALYKAQLTKNIYLKPDIQYVINPAGTDTKLPNALVGMVRIGIEF